MKYYNVSLAFRSKLLTMNNKGIISCDYKTYSLVNRLYDQHIYDMNQDRGHQLYKMCANMIKYYKLLNVLDKRILKHMNPIVLNMINNSIYGSNMHNVCLSERYKKDPSLCINLYGEKFHNKKDEITLGTITLGTIKMKEEVYEDNKGNKCKEDICNINKNNECIR